MGRMCVGVGVDGVGVGVDGLVLSWDLEWLAEGAGLGTQSMWCNTLAYDHITAPT